MLQVDYLIIGGGIAGTTCAETLRSHDLNAKIVILDSEKHPLYSKVLIPAYLKRKVSREKVFLRNISQYQSQGIELYSNTTVAAVDPAKKEVLTKDNKQFNYKKLLIASGGVPRKMSDVFSSTTPIEPLIMRNIDDMDVIRSVTDLAEDKKIIIAGEGFIAMEFMEIFSMHGFEVHMLSRGNFWGGEKRLGAEGCRILEDNIIRHNITIHRDADIVFIKNDEFYLKSGEHVRAPIWALGIGIARDFTFLPEVEKNQGFLCDEYLKTSDPDIFAAGDAAEYYDALFKKRILVGNWTNSFLQGRCAALNMLAEDGRAQVFKSVPTYNIVNMGLSLTFLGMVDCDPVEDIFELTDHDRFMRVFIVGGRAVGAVLINRFNDKIILNKIIENGYGREELEKTFKPANAGE